MMRMPTVVPIVLGCLLCAGAAHDLRAQQEHKSIHQTESELHHWDAVKLDPRVPVFARGKEYAIEGEYRRAIAAFTRGARTNRASAEFNIGLVYFYQHNYSAALRYFQHAERLRRDSATHDYLQTSRRLIDERSKQRMK
jgi:tetratricopeptide (TPR) repeat protein